MTETLHVRWKPGTLDTLIVTSAEGEQEWHRATFGRVFGRPALDALYLRGSVTVSREALPQATPAA